MGKLAELAEKYVKKGNSVIIEGEINYRSYENKDNQTIHITEIVGNALHFAGNKKEETVKENLVDAKSDPSYIPEELNDEMNDLPF